MTILRICFVQLGLFMLPLSAMAAADAEHGHGELSLPALLENTDFLASVECFALLVFLLWKFGRKPIGEFLTKRRSDMQHAMAEAAQMKAKAEARYQEYTARLEQLDAELEKLKTDIKQGAEQDKKKIMADAEEASLRMRKETEALIDMHAQALSGQLRRDVVEAATSVAREVLQGSVSPDDQARLAGEFRSDVVAQRGGQA